MRSTIISDFPKFRDQSSTLLIKFTREEGGDWHYIRIHSLELPDGLQWDALNGWRTVRPELANE